jgi:hypothetical protein
MKRQKMKTTEMNLNVYTYFPTAALSASGSALFSELRV